MSDERRERLLTDLAKEGAERCGYALNAEDWRNSRCDCKYIGPLGVADGHEQTGCCEIRAAYWLLLGDKLRPRPAASERTAETFIGEHMPDHWDGER